MQFLIDFHSFGAPFPKEFICDGARALLNAAVLTYSRLSNIQEYADGMKNTENIKTRIRMDVAHFKNKYRKHLKNINRRVFCLYMAAIGQLLMTQNLNEAEDIILAIFLLENCETEGFLPNGENSECLKKKTWLITLVTSKCEISYCK